MRKESAYDIDQEIKETEAKLEELRGKRNKLSMMSPEQRVAIFLHDHTCHADHNDGHCGWGYEVTAKGGHSWDGSAHKRYFEKAEKLVELIGEETAIQVVNILKGV